jgi:hypothetical protein
MPDALFTFRTDTPYREVVPQGRVRLDIVVTPAVTTPDARTRFPDSEEFRWGYADPKRAGQLQTGCWAYSILPYIGEGEAFRLADHTRAVPAYYIGTRREVKPQHVPKADPIYAKWTYRDAGLGPWGRTDYAANDQVVRGGMGNVMKPAEVKDGLAETFLLGEKAMDADAVKAGGWYWDEPIVLGGSGGTGHKGDRLMRDDLKLVEEVADNWGSPDPGGVWFLCCDGHARQFKYDTPRKHLAAMISPNKNAAADLPDGGGRNGRVMGRHAGRVVRAGNARQQHPRSKASVPPPPAVSLWRTPGARL